MNTYTMDPDYASLTGVDYYDGPEIVERLHEALTESGLDPDALDIDDLAPLDEFHALGRAATSSLAELAGVRRDDRVLDVGAGVGGPARFLAARYGAHVTALDATPRFCRAAEMLTRGTGLAGRVQVMRGDALALPFANDTFDLAWSQAVSQNIAEKGRFVSELARVVRPGGQVALFELVAGPGGSLEFPVPWADQEDQSWLVTAEELHELLDSEPLTVVAWRQGQETLDAIASAAQSLQTPAVDRGLGLQILMPNFEERMAALARNVADHKIALVQAVARRASA
jgi:SAM-dependent methyltransferase